MNNTENPMTIMSNKSDEAEQEAIDRLRRQLHWLADDVFDTLAGEKLSSEATDRTPAPARSKLRDMWRKLLARSVRPRSR